MLLNASEDPVPTLFHILGVLHLMLAPRQTQDIRTERGEG